MDKKDVEIVYQKVVNIGSPNTKWTSAFSIFLALFAMMTILFGINLFIMIYYKRINWTGNETYYFMVGMVLLLLCLIRTFIQYQKARKIITGPKHAFLGKLPTNDRPALVSLLFQANNLDASDLTATLMDLVNRGYVGLDQYYRVNDLINKNQVITFSLKTESVAGDQLNEYEKYLIDWFFKPPYTNTKTIDTKSLRQLLKNDLESGSKFSTWCSLVLNEFDKQGWVEIPWVKPDLKRKILNAIGISLILLPFFTLLLWEDLPVIVPGSLILTTYFVILLILTLMVFNDGNKSTKLSEKGLLALTDWNAFADYYKDNVSVNESELQKVLLYDKYLIYAIALNVASQSIKDSTNFYGKELYKFYHLKQPGDKFDWLDDNDFDFDDDD